MRSYEDHKKKNIGGKKSSGKGVLKLSTDAQSIAARQRRHRISERFKILQSLVPGGSKMDTVSMLEEAINYVKFLKTQIWLHQNMIINFATDINNNNDNAPDADTTTTTTNGYFLMQNYNLPPSADHQITTASADLLSAQPPNVVAEADVLPLPPQLGFPLQSAAYYSSYDQEILMAMPFDSNVFY